MIKDYYPYYKIHLAYINIIIIIPIGEIVK